MSSIWSGDGWIVIPVTQAHIDESMERNSSHCKGSIPTTLGGKLPPVSVLARREFGLRVLRK
jgi:hypothetical protein